MKPFIATFLYFGGMTALFPPTFIAGALNAIWLGAVWGIGLVFLTLLSNRILRECSKEIAKNNITWQSVANKMFIVIMGALLSGHILTAMFLAITTYIFCFKLDTYTGD